MFLTSILSPPTLFTLACLTMAHTVLANISELIYDLLKKKKDDVLANCMVDRKMQHEVEFGTMTSLKHDKYGLEHSTIILKSNSMYNL